MSNNKVEENEQTNDQNNIVQKNSDNDYAKNY